MAQQPLSPDDTSTAVSARLPSRTASRLDHLAEARGVRRSVLVREAVDAWLSEAAQPA